MNITERLLSLIPYETKIVRPIYDNGSISDVEVTSLDNINSPEEVVCNLLLTALLKCYGIDVTTSCGDYVSDTDYRIVMLRPLIECMTTKNKTIPDNGTTITLKKYMKKKHGVSNFTDFASALYSELSNSLYITNQKITYELDVEYLITITEECNQLCHTLAVAIANNDMFNVPFTPETYTLENWDETFDAIKSILKEDGKLAEDGILICSNDIVSKARELGLGYVSVFNLTARISEGISVDPYQGWYPVFVFTKKPILTYNITYVYSGQWWHTTTHFYDEDGEITRLAEPKKIANGYPRCGLLLETTTPYYENSSIVSVDVLGNDTPNSDVYQTELYIMGADRNVNPDITAVMLNNEDARTIGSPTISQRTEQNLEDNNIRLVSISPVSDNEFLKLNATNILSIVGLLQDPLDGGDSLDVSVIDPTLNVSLNDGVSNTEEITADQVAKYKKLWTNQVDELYKHGAVYNYFTFMLNESSLASLMSIYWEESFWDDKLGNIARDSTLKLFVLPYKLTTDEYNQPVDIAVGNLMGTDVQGNQVVKVRHVIESVPVAVPRKFKNFLDYEPNMKATIYLPFVGFRQLDPSMIVGCLVTIRYEISNNTGNFVVSVLSGNKTNYTDNYHGVPIFMETGCMGYDIPIIGRDNNATNILASLLGVIGGIATTATGNPLGLVGMAGGIKGMIDNMTGTIQNASLSGQSDASWVTNYSPYIILTYKEPIHSWSTRGTAFDKTIGKISQQGIYIKNCSAGYHEVDSVKLDGLRCTSEERKEIEEIIMGGFYYGSIDRRNYE